MTHVVVYGAGQLGTEVERKLRERPGVNVSGAFQRADREHALASGADVVVIATTTRLRDVADDVSAAVEAGSNVIVSAEEAAFPWPVDHDIAARIDELAVARGVTVLGGGVNPGFIFDALLLTLLGTFWDVPRIEISRDVNIGGFTATPQRRLGVGFTEEEFRRRVDEGTILGHAGFPQSMYIVADALGLHIERIEESIEPIIATTQVERALGPIEVGLSAGVRQVYVAWVDGEPWYTARFNGHVQPEAIGMEPRDVLRIARGAEVVATLSPGINPQLGSSSMIANSIDRVIAAEPGWRTVGELPPAHPDRRRAGDLPQSRRPRP